MGFSPFGGFGVMFTVVSVIVTIGFIVVIGIVIARSVQAAGQWKRNNASPVLTVEAAVVTKRHDVRHHHHTGDTHHMSTTTYYATFEVHSGDRLEFEIRDTEYGQLAEGDRGTLTFQGTRYLGFERNR
jgi:hypothetical protein